MFVDIEGCTHLCEDLPPSEMTRVIETYFSRYLDIVRDAGGEVTELLGDGLVALFEGPSIREDVTHAALAALRIREVTRELNARGRGRHRHPIVVNIGLNAGVASVGTTRLRGRSGERRFYTATGPVTNIAARLGALASRGQILVNGRMAEHLEGHHRLHRLGPRTVKNVGAPVEVVEILSSEGLGRARSGAIRSPLSPISARQGRRVRR
jgi:class 3 adenylate cyclase